MAALNAALTTEACAFDQAASKINTLQDLKSAGQVLSGPEVTDAGQQVRQACGAYWVAAASSAVASVVGSPSS